MLHDFEQIEWDRELEDHCRRLAELALDEDLGGGVDHTAAITVRADARGAALVVSRQAGIVAGLRVMPVVADVFGAEIRHENLASDGDAIDPGQSLARLEGRVRDMLAIERTILNFLGRLSGIATLTRRYVQASAGSRARLYDTRKTTPGWRLLEKYAVRCGGGHNHRSGLNSAILVKDNHIAAYQAGQAASPPPSLATLARSAREYAHELAGSSGRPLIVEVEVDSLAQLEDVLAGGPDIVLLDNMDLNTLRKAVALRNRFAPQVELEASGGVTLERLPNIVATGVERISVGALTHQATSLDIGLDWVD